MRDSIPLSQLKKLRQTIRHLLPKRPKKRKQIKINGKKSLKNKLIARYSKSLPSFLSSDSSKWSRRRSRKSL